MLNSDEVPKRLLPRLLRHNPSHFTKFSSLESGLEQVKFVYKELKRAKALPKLIRDGKNSYTAIKNKELGQIFSEMELHKTALLWYTSSIATARTDYGLTLGYAKRAECLFKLCKFRECVTVSIKFVIPVGFDKTFRISSAQSHLIAREI